MHESFKQDKSTRALERIANELAKLNKTLQQLVDKDKKND